jgi:type III pantothenate kinase
MLFAIDIGNSHTVIGLFTNNQLVGHWRFTSDRDQTKDELALQLHGLLSMIRLNPEEITGICLASVVPTLQTAWLACCQKYLTATIQLTVVSAETVKNIIQIKTDNPEEVGADRLVNSIAGWRQYRNNLVIIDFGTAITFDCVSADCAYLGGVILPGIAIALDALSSRTAKLPKIDLNSVQEKKIIGTNTVQAMKSGILHGYGLMVDGLTDKIRQEMGEADKPFTILATGGMAHLIAPYAQTIQVVDPLLTLKGLHCIHVSQESHG